uniref:Uncharacterized protein AlNc14C223G9153 n=1 Tax=Albugo laibachii Nc14 TaxID=890382 RepID=F0WS11_9STRA|nr:conserved hypothetical protein [Albugo laibachii Nc14]|eukprot:CCA24129.1 conserved hypothetical protein [Albugo laibachii Nc14]
MTIIHSLHSMYHQEPVADTSAHQRLCDAEESLSLYQTDTRKNTSNKHCTLSFTMETRSSPSMKELRAIAADRGLKYYLHLSKPELFALLQRKEGGGSSALRMDLNFGNTFCKKPLASNSMNTQWMKGRRWSLRLSLKKHSVKITENSQNRTKLRKRPINTVDPITLDELGPHTLEITRANGSIVAYNVENLVQYILATGDFSEPETRIPFSDEDLARLDYKAKNAKLDHDSVVEAKKNKHIFDEQKIKRDGILALERCAGELVTSMLNVVEGEDAEDGQLKLVIDLFPSFASVFNQLRRSDSHYAKQCMMHFKEFLKGPPNCPNEDQCGLLPVVLEFLDSVLNGKQNESAFGF